MATVASKLVSRAAGVASRAAHTAARADHYRVLVVGGGAGGISVASGLAKSAAGDVAIIEPSDTHWYQPLWTLVGNGSKMLSESKKPMRDVIPSGAEWIKGKFAEADPEANKITLDDGRTVTYDFLVMAAGININWDGVNGLTEALEADNGVSTNYSFKYVENTWKNIRKLEKGRALFTVPATPIKCAGAPLKIFLSAEDYWTTKGRRADIDAEYFSAMGKVFAIDKYAQALSAICDERSLPRNFFHNLVEVDAVGKTAKFAKIVDGKQTEETTTESFDMMHVTPPMRPIPALAASPLADQAGWIDVDKETLQHNRYPNVFALGDCSSLPTSKTAAAIAGQNGVLKTNLRSVMAGMAPEAKYDGYTSCPLVLGRKELMLAEFSGYTGQPLETFPYDQATPSKMAYWLKAEAMPVIYWDWLLKDRWHGVGQFRSMLGAFKDASHNTNPPATA